MNFAISEYWLCGVNDPKSADGLTQPCHLFLAMARGVLLDEVSRNLTVSMFGSLPVGRYSYHIHLNM